MKRIAIVGGGASGMMAAVAAARLGGNEIVVYEKNNRLGKKLLATGNGRCNITNINCNPENYHGRDPGFVKNALERFSPEAAIAFFDGIGLMCKTTRGGRVFPYCEQASAVLDILRNELAHMRVTVRENAEVTGIDVADGFRIRVETPAGNEHATCDRIIISTGGRAAPSTGSDGAGLNILSKLGHEIIEPYPALTQLKTEILPLRGIRLVGRVTVSLGTEVLDSSDGEIQFTAYGVSGPAVMDVSAAALTGGAVVALDLMPHMSEWELTDALISRRERLKHLNSENFLVGMLNKHVGQVLLKRVGIRMSWLVCELSDAQIELLARAIKSLELTVRGHTGWEHAQTTGGGAATDMINSVTMESALVKNLYVTGEALDIYGDCGGYNLQWAWSSGYMAGISCG